MIEIAGCLNDVDAGAVWRAKGSYTRLVRISSVWAQNVKGSTTVCVGFYLWDTQGTEAEREAWKVGKVLSQDDFTAEYEYAASHLLNNEREAKKTAYYLERLKTEISSNFAGYEERMAGLKALGMFATLTKRLAGYEILAHEWNEGCAGTGCCADTADMAGDKLVDENFLTENEIEELLSEH